jgi:hypothetical protein
MMGEAAGTALPAMLAHVQQDPGGSMRAVGRTAGRLAGLSGTDIDAVQAQGGMPFWFWLVLGAVAGLAAGAYAGCNHADMVPGPLGGSLGRGRKE